MKPIEPIMTYVEWENVMNSEDGEFRYTPTEFRHDWYQRYMKAIEGRNK